MVKVTDDLCYRLTGSIMVAKHWLFLAMHIQTEYLKRHIPIRRTIAFGNQQFGHSILGIDKYTEQAFIVRDHLQLTVR